MDSTTRIGHGFSFCSHGGVQNEHYGPKADFGSRWGHREAEFGWLLTRDNPHVVCSVLHPLRRVVPFDLEGGGRLEMTRREKRALQWRQLLSLLFMSNLVAG